MTSESIVKSKNLGGKFNVTSNDAYGGDQGYNNIKVVEVNSELNDLKDESINYGISDLRNYENQTFLRSIREMSPEE